MGVTSTITKLSSVVLMKKTEGQIQTFLMPEPAGNFFAECNEVALDLALKIKFEDPGERSSLYHISTPADAAVQWHR